MVRKQIEAKAQEEAEKQKIAQEKQKLLENEKSKLNLTPLVPASTLMPQRFGPKTFSPVSNLLAIQRAKEKVQQLKAQKLAQHQQFLPPKTKLAQAAPNSTIAQTTPKGSGRVAHINTAVQVELFIFPHEFSSSIII